MSKSWNTISCFFSKSWDTLSVFFQKVEAPCHFFLKFRHPISFFFKTLRHPISFFQKVETPYQFLFFSLPATSVIEAPVKNYVQSLTRPISDLPDVCVISPHCVFNLSYNQCCDNAPPSPSDNFDKKAAPIPIEDRDWMEGRWFKFFFFRIDKLCHCN